MKDIGSSPGNMRWLPFRNDSGEEIPPFACVKIVDGDLITGQHVLFAEKPDGEAGVYYFSGPRAVVAGEFGSCCVPAGPVWAAFDGSVEPGEEWGPVEGEWELSSDGDGFRIVGDSRDGRVLVDRMGGGGSEIINFEILERPEGYEEDECVSMPAKVIGVSCNQSSPEIDDEIELFDGLGCWFNVPEELLVGVKGKASRMKTPPDEGEPRVGDGYDDSDGCRWEVLSMCCPEEDSEGNGDGPGEG